MTVTTHNELIRAKIRYIRSYCKQEGWDFNNLKQDQAMEIRESKGYKQVTDKVVKEVYNAN